MDDSFRDSMSLSPGAARRSISSISSTSHHDSSSECTIQVEDDFSITVPKHLPPLPLSDKFLIEQTVSHRFQSPITPLTTISQLAFALGSDNIPYTTEIDTVPCAGIHIPYGPLTGLLAWRLVVRLASLTKENRGWWNDRRNSYAVPPVQSLRSHTHPYRAAPIPSNSSASTSALSLPLFPQVSSRAGSPNDDFAQKSRPGSVMLTRKPHVSSKPHSQTINTSHPQLDQTSPSLSNALVVNFILDTSLPHSIISRDTLIALGYPPSISHLASLSQDDKPTMVTLSIQNIPTRFHIARPDEASRLGVQFLHDAGVSVFFPKDGEGVGPVLYVESARLLKDVPRTIPLQGIGARLTLPQRVRALLGLS